MAFTNENSRFKTDVTLGFTHGSNQPKGSVFEGPIAGVQGRDYTLWLEHVVQKSDGEKLYWFVWYSPSGESATQTTAILHREDVLKTISQLIQVALGS